MDLTPEEMERLSKLDNLGKPVRTRFRDRERIGNQKILRGYIDDSVSEFSDGENKYEVQRIRCTPDQQEHHGEYLYRFAYYTVCRDGRLCLGGQFSPIMNEREMRSLLEQIDRKNWF
jgi:hypothetical protein